jgi:hypothetical protein
MDIKVLTGVIDFSIGRSLEQLIMTRVGYSVKVYGLME